MVEDSNNKMKFPSPHTISICLRANNREKFRMPIVVSNQKEIIFVEENTHYEPIAN